MKLKKERVLKISILIILLLVLYTVFEFLSMILINSYCYSKADSLSNEIAKQKVYPEDFPDFLDKESLLWIQKGHLVTAECQHKYRLPTPILDFLNKK